MPSNFNLIKWDKIRTEIETSKDIDVLLGIKDKLRAYQVLAEQSKQSMIVQSKIAIYKARADRKCGEWLAENVKYGGDRQSEKARYHVGTLLSDYDVTRNESSRLQKIASIPDEKFEEILLEAEEETKKISNNMLVSIAKEIEKSESLTTPIIKLPDGVFNVIYADPPWKYDNTGFEMSAEKHYPCMSIQEMIDKIKFNSSDNAILFLWVTNPFLKECYELIDGWGFEYKTNFVWIKKNHTAGFYVYGQHELLLICTKGKDNLPIEKFKSIIEGENKKHSEKPELVYTIIEKMYPNRKYLELFARRKREGWASYGNEL